MRFDAVAFDLDGTLYPNLALYAPAFPHMIPRARSLAAFSAARREIRRRGLVSGLGATANRAAFRALEAELTARRLGISAAEAAAMLDRVFFHGIEELFAKVRPFAGVAPALDALEGAGLRLALMSDLPPERKVELLGFGGRFDPLLCSEDSGALKPARAPFEMLASRLGLPPGRILYVGNSPRIDAEGAKAAGLSAAIVSRRRVAGADLSFRDWRKLVDFALT
jgi:putative hydrolase of the HAD superfamily